MSSLSAKCSKSVIFWSVFAYLLGILFHLLISCENFSNGIRMVKIPFMEVWMTKYPSLPPFHPSIVSTLTLYKPFVSQRIWREEMPSPILVDAKLCCCQSAGPHYCLQALLYYTSWSPLHLTCCTSGGCRQCLLHQGNGRDSKGDAIQHRAFLYTGGILTRPVQSHS